MCLDAHTHSHTHTHTLTDLLQVQVIIEELVLLKVGVLAGVQVVLHIVLDLADGVHLYGIVVQHAQDGLHHEDVVTMPLDHPLQFVYPVLFLTKRETKREAERQTDTEWHMEGEKDRHR